ncbi:MAG TPA: TonB-dependent receptor, partial [Flavitalea sp.]|nr:TonB-dependent receptor [Flavitalea sp.]
MRFVGLLLLFVYFQLQLSGQTIVQGTVTEKASGKPIEFASVELVQLPDSTTARVTATDKRGKFSFAGIPASTYFIRSSYIGYDKILSAPFSIQSGSQKYTVESLVLINASKTLTDVTVTARRAQLNASIDRKIYNVEQDIMSRSGSVADILKNIPSVEVDVEGNVSLRGSGDITILINGKPNPLMGRSRAEVLQQLPANSIERIEVITNPSARYRPDGTSGIINIVLKKNVKNGFNGSTTVNAGNRDRYNGNISLNYRPKKLNLFSSYSYRQDNRKRFNTIDRVYLDTTNHTVTSFFNQVTNTAMRPKGHILSGGIDYTIDDKNSIGVSGSYYDRKMQRKDVTNNFSYNNQKSLIQDFDRLRYDPETQTENNATLYYQRDFKKEDHDLRVEFNTSNENEVEDNHYTTNYRLPAPSSFLDNTLIKQIQHENQLTIDYSNPLSEDSKLEAGYDGAYIKQDLNFYGEFFDNNQSRFIKDAEKSNQFVYNENVHALYATYQRAFEKFGYEIGLRGEAVFTKSHLVTLDSTVNNTYYKIYPTVHLSYKLNDVGELQLNYSKRVNRPEGDELNPFPEYQDPRNLRAGNPKLLPEIIHSTEFGFRWQKKRFS